MAVWITDMYWDILSWTRLAHMMEGLNRAWPAIISLDSKSIELRMNMHQQCFVCLVQPKSSTHPSKILFCMRDVYVCWSVSRNWRTCVFRVACTNYLQCCGGGRHLYTPQNWSANFLYWWGEFSRPGSTTCQHPQEVIANHNTKLATNLLQAMDSKEASALDLSKHTQPKRRILLVVWGFCTQFLIVRLVFPGCLWWMVYLEQQSMCNNFLKMIGIEPRWSFRVSSMFPQNQLCSCLCWKNDQLTT
jgi:hypothetical protein